MSLQAGEQVERAVRVTGAKPVITLSTANARGAFDSGSPPRHYLRVFLKEGRKFLGVCLLQKKRNDCGRIPEPHRLPARAPFFDQRFGNCGPGCRWSRVGEEIIGNRPGPGGSEPFPDELIDVSVTCIDSNDSRHRNSAVSDHYLFATPDLGQVFAEA